MPSTNYDFQKILDHWDNEAKKFQWYKTHQTVLEGDFHGDVKIKWFKEGQTNITLNAVDRHAQKTPNKIAIIFEPNHPDSLAKKITYAELSVAVNRMASVYQQRGIKKGDVICFYMGMTPELVIGVLAAARIGAIHSVVFGGFSAQSLAGRIEDSGAVCLVTNDGAYRGEKIINLKTIVDEALQTCPTIKNVIVHQHTNNEHQMQAGRDFYLHDLLKNSDPNLECAVMDAEDPLFILYTSGSTGKPKGLLHTTAGYMVHAAYSFREVFDFKENDVFWCTADLGWITGHTYTTYGPLLNGGTTLIFEGIPTFPNGERFWQVIEKHRVTHFYTAPTAIRSLEALGDELPQKYKMDSLKVLGSVGEPINEEAWEWFHHNVGKSRCPIVDTWWQTETGGIMISTLANKTECVPSYATYPLFGITPILVDGSGEELKEIVSEGNLCIKFPWPSMARSIWGDHERFIQTYFSTYKGYYFTGDGAKRDDKNRYRITGRVDDVINVSGHRFGTAEIEDAIDEHADVVESAVIGYPHPIKGQGIYAFVICHHQRSDKDNLEKEIRDMVTKVIGPIAKPDLIQFVDALPKTRSGKIMRRILRKIGENELGSLGDTSTLLDPDVVNRIIKGKKN